MDAKTGKVVWLVKTGDPGKGETGTDAPMVIKDRGMIIGNSGGEFGVRGWFGAYSTKDGKELWGARTRWDRTAIALIDPQKNNDSSAKTVGAEFSLKTWQGNQWKIGGGPTWGWKSYDCSSNLI